MKHNFDANKERYDYYAAVKDSVIDYITDNYDRSQIQEIVNDPDSYYDVLYDDMFMADSVTGNASESYTCSSWQAELYLCHNTGLLFDALKEFGCSIDYLEKGPEACDVTIRCYVLFTAIYGALDELKKEY